MKRTVARLVGPERIEMFTEDIPKLGPDDVLYKNISVGLCHSDIPAYLGQSSMGTHRLGYPGMVEGVPYPHAFGHEPVAQVVEVGENVKKFVPGDKVSGIWGGVFADYFVAPVGGLVKVPELPADKPIEYCLGEPLNCISNIARCAAPEFGDSVAIIGCGVMGLLTIAALASKNLHRLTAIDLNPDRLALAQKYGAESTINPAKEDLDERAYELTNKAGYDIVIEITGSLRGLDSALSIIRIAERLTYKGRGKILIPSLYAKKEEWNPNTGYNLMYRAPILHSTHPMYAQDLEQNVARGMEMYAKGVLPMEEMITHVFPFEELQKGMQTLYQNKDGFIKGIIKF